ncbi:MAG: response regulator [Candidatus Cloacimonetes bacterium]|nr:response regulator [Candidatus Cloacimonadota bacterium]
MKKKIRLLIVDDDQDYSLSLKMMIMAHYSNIEVVTASGGMEAFRMVQRGNIDAVLTDVSMPDMDGCELYSKITSFKPEIQVIMMSAYYDAKHTLVRAKLLGLKDVVPSLELIEKRELVERIYDKIEEHFLREEGDNDDK